MILSYNQLLTTAIKAFEALGYAPGDREDAAEMIAWCELHGLGVIDDAVETLDTWREPSYAPFRPEFSPDGTLTFDGEGRPAVLVGPLAAEAVYAQAVQTEPETAVGIVKNMSHTHLLIGYLPRIAGRGLAVRLEWGEHVAFFGAHAAVPTMWQTESDLPHARLTISTRPSDILNAPPLHTPAQLTANFHNHRQNGIPIYPPVWEKLGRFAQEILVESSPESRAFGAGETSVN